VLRQGKEDCDGRAVVAASILRRMGYEAWLVSDFLHCWVQTPTGETMSPGTGQKTLIGGRRADRPTTLQLSGLASNLGRGLAYGVAVFPLERESIILAALLLLTTHPRISRARWITGAALLLLAWAGLRFSGESAVRGSQPDAWIAVLAACTALVGWLVIAVKGRAWPPHSVQARPE
jgi:hypothetical protein